MLINWALETRENRARNNGIEELSRQAEIASQKARELFREIGAREMYVDVRLAPAALSAPGAGWARTKRPSNGGAMV